MKLSPGITINLYRLKLVVVLTSKTGVLLQDLGGDEVQLTGNCETKGLAFNN
jgi:hypothetical protein